MSVFWMSYVYTWSESRDALKLDLVKFIVYLSIILHNLVEEINVSLSPSLSKTPRQACLVIESTSSLSML